MATDKIRVMISSRSNRPVFDPPIRLAVMRRDLKTYIETELTLNGDPVFEVWICEVDTGQGIDNWWETSKVEVRKADLLLVLYTGEAGSRVRDVGFGICHAELFEAVQYSREKVLPIPTMGDVDSPDKPEDRNFQKYVRELNPWPNSPTNTNELHEHCARILHRGLVTLTKRAVRSRLGAGFDMGNALDWSKLDFAARKQKIETVLLDFLRDMGSKRSPRRKAQTDRQVVAAIGGKRVLWCVHAIPAATTISAAREMVGQPFLHDHLTFPMLKQSKSVGPVHLIGCHKSITESQALKIRGVDDCTLVKTDFGIYLADSIQKIQMLFLANCRDLTATQSAITEMFHWLEDSDEKVDIVQRAQSRKKILKAVADEMGTP